jgi:hypothetical protein
MRVVVDHAVLLLGAVALALIAACGGDDDDEGPQNMGEPVTWCQAEAVLEAKCQRCHANPPQNGAPFPLVTYDDTQVETAGTPRWIKMKHVVENDIMPPTFLPDLMPPVEPLTSGEKKELLDWLEQGALPAGGTNCD